MMNILCTICSDLFNQAENIYVTKCGHIFHHHCLAQWIERSKTCPQCRNKVTEKCMFRLYPTVSNENNGENAAALQSQLDNAELELRQLRAKFKEKEDFIASLIIDLTKQENLTATYEKRLISFDAKVRALRDQLMYANIQANETRMLKEENERLKNNMQTLNGLQKVLNATTDEVEQMLQSYTDARTIATFATALKRALCESESKKNECRDKLHIAKQQLAIEKKTETDLKTKLRCLESQLHNKEATVESLTKQLKFALRSIETTSPVQSTQTPNHDTPHLNDAILDTDNCNSSFNTMVNNIENSDSPYLNLKQGGLLCLTALQRAPIKIPDTAKPSEHLYLNSIKNAFNKRSDAQKSTSIFHKKEAMNIESVDTHSPSDISYDGLGGHSKLDVFPIPKKSPKKSCIPKVTAKHKLKRPNPGNRDIQQMLKKIKDK